MAKFYRKGLSQMYFLPTIAGTSPTRAEITAGTRLRGIVAISGFSKSSATIDVPDMDSRFVSKIPGDETVADCSLTFDDDAATAPAARTVLADGVIGKIVAMPYGDVPTKRCEVWPVQSTGVNDQWDATGSTSAQFVASFAVLTPPTQNAVIPAAT